MRQRRSSRGFRTVLFGLALLHMNVAVCLGAEPELPLLVGEPVRGRDLYMEKGCISCHALRGSGGKVGPDLAAALVGKGIIGIAAAMLDHYPKMNAAMHQKNAALPHLDPGEMDDVVAYLLFINFAREPGSPENGRLLFSQKGCIKCHWTRPDGTSPGPPLGQASLSAPPITIAQEMWNHGTQMNATMQQLQIERPVFEGHQMADVLAFLSGAAEPLVRGTLLPGAPVLGRDLFESKGCARCHVKDKVGQSIGPDLSNGKWYMTATEIAGEMWNHGPAMWSLMRELGITPARFEDDGLADVIAYLYLVRSAKGSENAARGRELFSSKHCAQCHERGGPGPDLATVPQLDSPIHFATEMWNHAPRMQAFVSHAGIDWPRFEADDVSDLVSYVHQRRAGAMN
jgi:mono/diheme cytochrome c family protein